MHLYTPDASENNPDASWRPTLTSFPQTLVQGHTYTVTVAANDPNGHFETDVANLKAMLEDRITPRSVRDNNSAIYVVLARRTADPPAEGAARISQ